MNDSSHDRRQFHFQTAPPQNPIHSMRENDSAWPIFRAEVQFAQIVVFVRLSKSVNLRNDPVMYLDDVWIHGRPGKRCRVVPIQTENPSNRTSHRRKIQYTIMGIHRNELSGWRDLNPRPLRPERSALPGCATPRSRTLTHSGPPGSTTIPL